MSKDHSILPLVTMMDRTGRPRHLKFYQMACRVNEAIVECIQPVSTERWQTLSKRTYGASLKGNRAVAEGTAAGKAIDLNNSIKLGGSGDFSEVDALVKDPSRLATGQAGVTLRVHGVNLDLFDAHIITRSIDKVLPILYEGASLKNLYQHLIVRRADVTCFMAITGRDAPMFFHLALLGCGSQEEVEGCWEMRRHSLEPWVPASTVLKIGRNPTLSIEGPMSIEITEGDVGPGHFVSSVLHLGEHADGEATPRFGWDGDGGIQVDGVSQAPLILQIRCRVDNSVLRFADKLKRIDNPVPLSSKKRLPNAADLIRYVPKRPGHLASIMASEGSDAFLTVLRESLDSIMNFAFRP